MTIAAATACRECGAATGFADQLCTVCRGARRPVLDPPAPVQELLPGMGPMVGERWRNTNTGTIAAIVKTDLRRYGWVTVRILDGEQQLTLARFLRVFERI